MQELPADIDEKEGDAMSDTEARIQNDILHMLREHLKNPQQIPDHPPPRLCGLQIKSLFVCAKCAGLIASRGSITFPHAWRPVFIYSPCAIKETCCLCGTVVEEISQRLPPVTDCPTCGSPRTLRCLKCGNIWAPRGPLLPGACPACNSESWEHPEAKVK